jgi:hypothetical protein
MKSKGNPFITHKGIVLDWRKDVGPVTVKKRHKYYVKEVTHLKEDNHAHYTGSNRKSIEGKQEEKERKRTNQTSLQRVQKKDMVHHIEVKNILSTKQHKNERAFRHRTHIPNEVHIQFICN